ncbi:hypothetical protein CEXT_160271 [Caerostris extrusa]|uniref:Uncharacterized protein n=1 Tax=Caerostris extrusa TaxID=172846 RepID=A0AAV4MSY1_CAEEX|nr:hypothetical protein CEXT_160271 [Caerostris extrusa]
MQNARAVEPFIRWTPSKTSQEVRPTSQAPPLPLQALLKGRSVSVWLGVLPEGRPPKEVVCPRKSADGFPRGCIDRRGKSPQLKSFAVAV